ncbi:MAG: ImmA/IrrE family metallo-endopeptidase [bacterium]|nr:ImmA/IrrE family metallo-endopeptidase [bacterium]
MKINVESELGIDIVPIPNLQDVYHIEAFLSNDLKTIYVDQNVYFNYETRYRFSIAHEIGHYYLHKNFYEMITFDKPEEWMGIYQSLNDTTHSKLEFQAYSFASYILIPDYHLKDNFSNELNAIMELINNAKENKIDRNTYLDYAIDRLALKLAPCYNVSTACMEKRIKYDPTYIDRIP